MLTLEEAKICCEYHIIAHFSPRFAYIYLRPRCKKRVKIPGTRELLSSPSLQERLSLNCSFTACTETRTRAMRCLTMSPSRSTTFPPEPKPSIAPMPSTGVTSLGLVITTIVSWQAIPITGRTRRLTTPLLTRRSTITSREKQSTPPWEERLAIPTHPGATAPRRKRS